MQSLRVALAQISPVLGDVSANLNLHLEQIEAAKQQGADLIIFPELGLTGYSLKDMALDVARDCKHLDIVTLLEASKSIDIVFSFVEESEDHRFYTSSIYAAKGEIKHKHRKVYLPTYGLFEEGRQFARGDDIQAFTHDDVRFGMMICEDAWHPSVPYLLSLAGVDVMMITAAGPGRALSGDPNSASQAFWERMVRTYAQLFTTYVIFVNRTGFEDGVFFFGHSLVANPQGELIGGVFSHEVGLAVVDLPMQLLRKVRFRTPLLRDEDPYLTERVLRRLTGGN